MVKPLERGKHRLLSFLSAVPRGGIQWPFSITGCTFFYHIGPTTYLVHAPGGRKEGRKEVIVGGGARFTNSVATLSRSEMREERAPQRSRRPCESVPLSSGYDVARVPVSSSGRKMKGGSRFSLPTGPGAALLFRTPGDEARRSAPGGTLDPRRCHGLAVVLPYSGSGGGLCCDRLSGGREERCRRTLIESCVTYIASSSWSRPPIGNHRGKRPFCWLLERIVPSPQIDPALLWLSFLGLVEF